MMMCGGPGMKLLMSLALGYFVCVVAKKQQDLLRTVGYTIGIAIIVLALGWAAVVTIAMPDMGKCMKMMGGHKGMKHSMMR